MAQAVASAQGNLVNADALSIKLWMARVEMREKIMLMKIERHGKESQEAQDAMDAYAAVVEAEPTLQGAPSYTAGRELCAGPTKPSAANTPASVIPAHSSSAGGGGRKRAPMSANAKGKAPAYLSNTDSDEQLMDQDDDLPFENAGGSENGEGA
jgi:hypothetical protein